MQTAEAPPEPQFAGSSEEQQTARMIFDAMRGMARFFSRSAAIRASVESLAGYMASREPSRDSAAWSTEIARVLALNPDVFELQDTNDQMIAVTTSTGQAPRTVEGPDTQHTLARRLSEPRPVSEKRWTSARRAAQAEVLQPVVEPVIETRPAAVASLPVEFDEEEAAEEAAPAEIVEAPTAAVTADIAALSDEQLAGVIERELRVEVSVANFGDLWMAEDKTPRLSRGDLRRIHDYIAERNEPLAARTLVDDVLNIRPGSDNYDLMRFAVDYRLSRETKEFEFVGTPRSHLWSTIGLQSIGTSKRKPSEIGSDYRFLLSEEPVELAPAETVVEHVLTFYEYQYGVLPLDPVLQAFFPKQVLPEQRAAVLSFESPQTYETFFVELRYPTGNRGGYVAGFDRFYLENLVPGALFTIERNAEDDGKYLIEFLPVSGETEKLLQIDEKKNRYVFRPRTFYCATSDEMLLTENRFPQFANAAPLEDRARRRPELALGATFERTGEQVGTADAPRYMAMIDDLVAAANVERPMSAELIRSLATAGAHPEFTQDAETPDVFYYEPAGE